VSSCGVAVHSGTVRRVKSVGVLSGGGVVVMRTIPVTTLHRQWLGNSELPLRSRLCCPH
jgi:hypothetical protein